MILVSGSLAHDYIMDFPGYFRDHIIPEKLHALSVSFFINKMERNFGGTAGNIAYNLALLGEKPTILASAGNDFMAYSKWLIAKGIDISKVRKIAHLPTAGAYIMTDQADNQITGFYPGAMGVRYQGSGIRSQVVKKAKLAIVAPGNLEDIRALVKVYKKYRAPYIFDPGQVITALTPQDLRNGIDGAEVFISNDYELEMVLKKTGWKKRDILRRVKVLVTTLGERGSVIEGGVGCWSIPPAKPKNVSDPTGAGDAYRAGFIKGLLLGLPYDKVGKLASTVAAYTVEKYGTQTHSFTWEDVLKRYRTNYKENLL